MIRAKLAYSGHEIAGGGLSAQHRPGFVPRAKPNVFIICGPLELVLQRRVGRHWGGTARKHTAGVSPILAGPHLPTQEMREGTSALSLRLSQDPL